MTDELYKTLTAKNVKHRTHADKLEPTYFTEGLPNREGVKKFDLNKAYKYAMRNIPTLYGLDITQRITPTKKLNGSGLYYVEPYDKGGVLHGANWYSLEILQYAEEIGEYFKIKYVINTTTRRNQFN